MKYFLKSPFPCLVKANSCECELDPNDTLEIEDEKRIYIFPHATNLIPFFVDLNTQKDCERYSFVRHNESMYIILENSPRFCLKTKQKLNFSGKIVEIGAEGNILSFETSDTKIACKSDEVIKDFSCFKIGSFACVQLENELFLFQIKENKIYHFSGDIEINGNQISVIKKFYDSEMREKKSLFTVTEEIELESEEFISNAQKNNVKDLAPYRLMESVKAKDYTHALDFLSEKLKAQTDVTQIAEFFGNFSTFLPISTTEFITLGKHKNFVQFSMTENKIDDISVDNL